MSAAERFTDRARRVLVAAQELAAERGHFIDAEHILEAVASSGGIGGRVLTESGLDVTTIRDKVLGLHPAVNRPPASAALASLGIDVDEVRSSIVENHGEAAAQMAGDNQPPFSVEGKQTLEECVRAMVSLGHEHLGTEHLLLAVLKQTDSVAVRTLKQLGADPESVAARVRTTIGAADDR